MSSQDNGRNSISPVVLINVCWVPALDGLFFLMETRPLCWSAPALSISLALSEVKTRTLSIWRPLWTPLLLLVDPIPSESANHFAHNYWHAPTLRQCIEDDYFLNKCGCKNLHPVFKMQAFRILMLPFIIMSFCYWALLNPFQLPLSVWESDRKSEQEISEYACK